MVHLTPKALDIISLIKEANYNYGVSDDDYIFVNERGRIHIISIDKRLRKYCEQLGIQEKSPHKIRKTYISTLIDSNINMNTVRELVGHTDERTTYNNYCYERLPENELDISLNKALNF